MARLLWEAPENNLFSTGGDLQIELLKHNVDASLSIYF